MPGPGGESRLTRSLTLSDAIAVGLSSMIGAGIFTALAPAAAAAGAGLIVGLGIAAAIAYCNATSSAQLARLYPASGGTYVYANERLGDVWSWAAGWSFIAGKTASSSAVALTFGTYLAPGYARELAAGAIIAFTLFNYTGVRRTAGVATAIVAVVLISLLITAALVVTGLYGTGEPHLSAGPWSLYGILQSAGIWFFAFAGYSRIATLGEEVHKPERTIPRAILLALGIALAVYAAVVIPVLLLVGPAALAAASAPLVTAVEVAGAGEWAWIVRIGSTFATLGVLLSLMAGVSRMLFAVAADRRLPSALAHVHPVYRTPDAAGLVVGAVLVATVLLVDLRPAIGFSSFCVLLYYAVTNLAACRLKPGERLYSRVLPAAGLPGCLVLAFTLPLESVAAGSLVILVGLVLFRLHRDA